jgi:hypothetical protein
MNNGRCSNHLDREIAATPATHAEILQRIDRMETQITHRLDALMAFLGKQATQAEGDMKMQSVRMNRQEERQFAIVRLLGALYQELTGRPVAPLAGGVGQLPPRDTLRDDPQGLGSQSERDNGQ